MLAKSGLAGPEAVEGCWMCCEEEGSSHSARHRKSEMLCGGQTGSGSCARDRRELASPAKGRVSVLWSCPWEVYRDESMKAFKITGDCHSCQSRVHH